MTRRIVMVSLLGIVACSQSESSKASESPPPAAAQAPTSEPAPAEDNTTTKLDPAKVKAFVAYREGMMSLFKELTKVGEKFDEREKQAGGGTLGFITAHMRTGMEAQGVADKMKALQTRLGLSDGEISDFGRIEAAVVARARVKDTDLTAAKAQMDKIMASVPKDAPPEARAEVQAQIDEMNATLKQMTSLNEERATFGDAVVDAMLAEQDALVRQEKAFWGGP